MKMCDMRPIIYYWSSSTGGTKSVADRLITSTLPIHPEAKAQQPYILMCPTYDAPRAKGFTPKPVKDFLRDNHELMVGVIGTGNRNFGGNYCRAAHNISAKFQVPIIHTIDLRGTQKDIQDIDTKLRADWRSFIEHKGEQWKNNHLSSTTSTSTGS